VAGPFLSDDPQQADYLRIARTASWRRAAPAAAICPSTSGHSAGDSAEGRRLVHAIAGSRQTHRLDSGSASRPWRSSGHRPWSSGVPQRPRDLDRRPGRQSDVFPPSARAFDKVKPGQVIKVLDKGRIGNRSSDPPPDNVALVSEVGTRIEIPKWHLGRRTARKRTKTSIRASSSIPRAGSAGRLARYLPRGCRPIPLPSSAIELAVGGSSWSSPAGAAHTALRRDMSAAGFQGRGLPRLRLGADDSGPVRRQVVARQLSRRHGGFRPRQVRPACSWNETA